jgi:hypothetical protein
MMYTQNKRHQPRLIPSMIYVEAKVNLFSSFHVFQLLRAKYGSPAAISGAQIIHLRQARTYEDDFIVLISCTSIVSILLVCLTSD